MAVAIAEIAATGIDLRESDAQDRIVARWVDWARVAKDVGIQTRSVLYRASNAASAKEAAAQLNAQTGRTAGNGSLMRTAPVALAYLDDEDALAEAATQISELTHFDPDAGEACVLWCLAIRHAVLTGELDVRVGLSRLDPGRQAMWAERIETAEGSTPADFVNNGWVVEALQGAWSAIATAQEGADRLRLGIEAAVRGGRDADTVAAIAGGLLGAAHGASAVPTEWRQALTGWPGLSADDLVTLAAAIIRRGAPGE
jgi:ADP-ribosylglycohydrolase